MPGTRLAARRLSLGLGHSLALAGLLWGAPAGAGETTLRVAVAGNFRATLEQLAPRFHARQGARVRISAASSGVLYTQILLGAPFDLFLSADPRHPELLELSGHAVAGSRRSYALGRVVLLLRDAAAPAPPPNRAAWRAALEQLAPQQVAIANPAVAPYGRASREILRFLGLWQPWRGRLVQGSNVLQSVQFFTTGNVALAFGAASQLVGRPEWRHWPVPGEFHRPLEQQAVILARAREKPAAHALLRFLGSREARALIRERGYALPEPPGRKG